MPDLLLELFSEEIPARMQARAGEDLSRLIEEGLTKAGIYHAGSKAFSTPRRLTLTVSDVAKQTYSIETEAKGPRVGAPEAALQGFLRNQGAEESELEIREDSKGQYYHLSKTEPSVPSIGLIAEVVEATIRNFPWPKSMRWGAGSLRWVRPLHSILCILTDEEGAEVVPFAVDGIEAGNTTEGHRFMSSGRFAVTSFDDYEAKLKAAKVVLDPAERADHIWEDAKNLAFAQGLEVVEDRGLLAEVAGLVEWPVVLMGDIAEDFIGLPPEVLQTSMKEHQKFFSVRDPKSGKIVKFITVANRETADNGKTILAGNQKVLFARLSDAKFFWENDLRTVEREGLEGMAAPLANVTFHNKLGTQAERIARIEALAREIAPLVGAKPDLAAEAARVAKADLASEMVYEFPELQGTMGRYYAAHAGHDDGVPEACAEHYSPLGPSDDVPSAPVSVAVALADKIDALTGFWAIDEKPTGSKDPFALRRAALGVIRLVLNNKLRLHMDRLFDSQILRIKLGGDGVKGKLLATLATHGFHTEMETQIAAAGAEGQHWKDAAFSSGVGEISDDLVAFFHDRLKVYLRDEGISHDVIDAVLAMPNRDDIALVVMRAEALTAFLKTDDGTNLLQGYKRANNILAAEEKKDGVAYEGTPDVKFAEEDAEKDLFTALDSAEPAISAALKAEDFAAAMQAMAALRAPIDQFFETVQVNADNQIVRRNRLCLLNRIREVMQKVAIFSAIEG